MKLHKGMIFVTVASVICFIISVYVAAVSILSLTCGEYDDEEEE